MPFNLNDSINPFDAPSNIIGQINALASQVKKMIGAQSWKDEPQFSIASFGNTPNTQHPGWIPGRYYGTPTGLMDVGVGGHIVNAFNWQHFPIAKPLKIDAIAIRVDYLSSGARIKMGIYNVDENTALPTTKILDSGLITITSTGIKQTVFTPTVLPVGMYAIAFIVGDADSLLRLQGNLYARHQNALFFNGTTSFSGVNYYNQNFAILPSFELPSDLTSITSWDIRLESPTVVVRATA